MLSRVLVLAALLVPATLAPAQTTPAGKAAPTAPNATPDPLAVKLDRYLQRWEQEMVKVQTLSALLTREDKDKTFGTTTKFAGEANYMKAGNGPTALNLAALELKVQGKNDVADKFVCTGTYLYRWLPAQKEIHAYEMPKPKPGQVGDESFLGFLFGMKAEAARRRYQLTLPKLKHSEIPGEDNHYVYVDIVPRFPEDKAEFTRARLVLNKDSFLPRQLWFEHANGTEITWDIPRLQAGVTLNRRLFDAPKVPDGWKMVPVAKQQAAPGGPVPANVPPNKVRPAGGER